MKKIIKQFFLSLVLLSLILGNSINIYADPSDTPSEEPFTENINTDYDEETNSDEVYNENDNSEQSSNDNSQGAIEDNDFQAPEATISNEELKEAKSQPIKGVKSADFVFIIDSTGSMGSYINSVRSNLTAFVQYLNAKGIDIRMSVIDYKDILEDGPDSTTIHDIGGSVWSTDANQVIDTFSNISVNGGGDDPETPTDPLSIIADSSWQWREDAKKFAFILTDQDFKDSDYDSTLINMDTIIGKLRHDEAQVSVVSKKSYEYRYKNLYSLTGGKFIDIDSTDYYKLMIEVADWVFDALEDSDNDGLPDEWEINGVDVDKDGKIDIPLNKMGADPNKKDIFVEIDWMHRLEEKDSFLWWDVIKAKERSFAPSQASLKMAYEQFKNHDINLHIDAGPDSIDYVTGNKWGDLSGGNKLDYSANLDLGDNLENWNNIAMNNFDKDKWNIFRYCLFIDDYNNSGSSGIAENIPGQFFIVSGEWVHDLGDGAVTRTFMHELGHTLGLCHGGSDHVNYKPNYLSIMNYSFQLSGLLGNDSLTYSEYVLPELNENNLDENIGIDSSGITAGSNLGTKWKYYKEGLFGFLFSGEESKEGYAISKKSLDFNNNKKIETNISEDINGDKEKNILSESINDWNSIVFKGGLIGGRGDSIGDTDTLISKDPSSPIMDELDKNEAIENGLLGNPGDCIIESVTPNQIYTETKNQTLNVKINNLYQDTSTATLKVKSPLINKEFTKEVNIPKTTTEIGSKTVEVPIKDNLKSGNYPVNCTLLLENKKEVTFNTTVTVTDVQTVSIKLGENKDLIPDANLKDLNFTWSSSDNSIVEINDGVVSGKKIGKATVYGTLENNDKIICIVNVVDKNHVHKYNSDWSNNNTYHYHECSCGDKKDVEKHKFSEWTETKSPTNNKPGSKERICSICNYKEVVEIPALYPSADTGDKSSLPLFLIVLISSIAVLAFVITQRKKINKK